MKKLYLLFTLVVTGSLQTTATIRTLSNYPFSPGQFTTFAAAHTACNNNDTIYVHGSTVTYGVISITKPGIVVIGTGHNPVKQGPLVSAFTNITISAISCQLIGLAFDNLTANSNLLTVKRCKILQPAAGPFGIMSGGTSQNWTIEGNVFSGINSNLILNLNSSNTTVSNNIFNGQVAIQGGNSSTLSTFIIANNIFIGVSASVFNVGNAVINNNIFYRASPQGATLGCVMNNNISFSCSNNGFSAPGVSNLVNVNPLFTSFPLAGALFDYSHNYKLAAGSPGLNNGSDGTDRGVFGGFGAKFSMTGEPAIAEITGFVITSSPVIAPGGTLNINVTSKRVR